VVVIWELKKSREYTLTAAWMASTVEVVLPSLTSQL
jgi:hypothetical protein